MPRYRSRGKVGIKREYEIDPFLYRVSYTVSTSWDNIRREWDVDDVSIDWIQQIDDAGNILYPTLESLPLDVQKEINNVEPDYDELAQVDEPR